MRYCFYSRLVRLKLFFTAPHPAPVQTFLFQIGAIKTDIDAAREILSDLFLFQIGAIKTVNEAEQKVFEKVSIPDWCD